jgi:hypothetical protein
MAMMSNPCGMPDDQYAALNDEQKQQCAIQAQQAQQMRQQPQGGSGMMSPSMAMNFIPESGGAAAGGGGEAGGAMAGMAAPAALAAAIIANETYQNKSGNRPEDFGDHMTELATGEVLERDVERYLGDSKVAKQLGRMGNPKGLAKNMKQSLKPWEWFF